MANFEFAGARLAHTRWRLRLNAYVDGGEGIPESELTSSHACDLGKWIDATGFRTYNAFSQMQQLRTVHEQVHTLARDIVSAKKSGKVDEARTLLRSLDTSTDKIVALLRELEAFVAKTTPAKS